MAVVAGVALMVRSRGGLGDELGSGLILVGAWGTVAGAIANFGLDLGISYPTVDVTVTLGVLLAGRRALATDDARAAADRGDGAGLLLAGHQPR